MTARLGRVAGCLALALATARCADKILAPVANAGTAVTVNMGSSVALDGRSSTDPQGRSLAYDWSITARPVLSQTSLNDARIATPSFIPDLDGSYTIDLVVSNGVLSSPASQVIVTARKCSQAAPEITAAVAAPANPNILTSVQLSATVHDADNDPACNLNQTSTLLWTAVARPGASVRVLSDPTAASPTFVPDQVGSYQFSVVATDSTGLQSVPKFVTFDTTTCGSAKPSIASGTASPTTPNPGDVVTLSAVVTDSDNLPACNLGQTLSFEWRLTGRPAASSATLSDPTTQSPTITPDAVGTYQLLVTVTDSTGRVSNMMPVSFTTTACGSAVPTITSATASPATPNIGTAVLLSATAADADNSPTCHRGQTLTFHWALVSRPASSSAFLDDLASGSPSFTPDAVGTYQFSVTVSDGTGNTSPPTFVGVTTTTCGTHAPAATIASSPASPVPGSTIQLTPTVTDADNAGTCLLNQGFTYAWTLTRPPSSATALLSSPTATTPSFIPDVPGTYRATLTVTDSLGLSSEVAVKDIVVGPCGAAAVTFAAPAITAAFAEAAANVGAAVTLTAHPVDPAVACGVPAGPVQYVWTLAGPSGSSAVAFAVQAGTQFTFTPDVVGTYDVSVRAVDARGESASASTSVSTTTCGAAPIAVLVTPSSSTVNSFESLTLTAAPAATTCPARFAPVIAWAVAGVGAPARLSASFGGTVDFRGTGAGDYVVSAVAINTSGHEGPVGTASVHVNACGSRPPVVVTTSNSPTFPARRQTVTLSATAVDPDASCGDARLSTIAFELLSIPQGSGLSFPAGANSFQADVEGTYAFRVVATEDGTGLRSDAAVLNVTVLDPDPTASTLTAVPTSGAAFVVADNVDSASLTVSVRNRLGQPIGSLPVSVASSGLNNTFNPLSAGGSTNASGVFVATMTSTKAETKTFTATANPVFAPVVLNNHPSLSFVAGPTASISLTGLPASVTAGDLSTVTVTAFDKFANVAKGPNAYTGTVQFTSTDPGATLPADFTFATGDDGTHTFTNGVRLITAGSRTVTVKDASKPALTDSQTAVVSPAAPATVAFTVQPSTATAGISISPAVETTVKDAFANLVPNASVTVSIGSGPAATLFGTKTRSTNTSGVASFGDLSIQKTGTYTLHAAVTGTPGADSNSFDITAAAPATAVFSVQPTSATAGVAISPAVEVTVKDAFTNLVPGASVTVSLGTNPTGALLFGTKTQSTGTNGVASFANLSIQKAGAGYKLHAAVTGTPGDDSTAFDITAAAPATAVFTVQPSTTTAGVHITPAVEVTVKDAFANLVSSASVTVSIGTNPASGTLSGTLIQSTSASGVASFANLSIDKAGVGYKLHAAVTGTPGDDSTAFDITAAAPATASFTVQPTTTTTNLHITPAVEVTVKDAFANLVPGASVAMAIGTNPASGTLSGTTPQLTNASGVATFANLSIDKAGTGYTLRATVSSTPTDVVQDSGLFDVVIPPVITSFVAGPTSIFSSGATQLSFVFTGGTGSINPGALSVTTSVLILVTNITATTTFTLKVTNAAGTFVTATADVTVTTATGWVDLNNAVATPPDTRAAQPFSLTFDPANASILYAGTLADGVLTTSTGGPPWAKTNFPAGVPAQGVSVGHPNGTLSLWASTNQVGQLYHSTDASTWTAITGGGLPAVATVQRTAIRLDPSDPLQKTLYVIFNQGGLFRTIDDGVTWSNVPLPLTATTTDDQPTALAISSNGTVFVGTAPGNLFHVSGTTATLIATADLGSSQVDAIAADPEGTTIVAGHVDGVVEFGTGPGFAMTKGATLTGTVAGLAFAVDGFSSSGVITGSTYAVTATGTLSGGTIHRSTDFAATFKDVTTAAPAIDTSDYFFVAPQPGDGTTLYVLGQSSGFFKRTLGAP